MRYFGIFLLLFPILLSCQSLLTRDSLEDPQVSNRYLITQVQQVSINHYTAAIRAYHQILTFREVTHSELVEIYYELGFLYHKKSKRQLAEEFLEKAITSYHLLPDQEQQVLRWVLVLSSQFLEVSRSS